MYKEYSLYPKIIKDLSFIIQKIYTFERTSKNFILMEQNFYLKLNLLDEYKGESIPEIILVYVYN
jgi:phenylalanyl-tRNA synthetase beta subunit